MLGPGTPIACLFLPVRINGDVALLKGIMKEMLEEDRAHRRQGAGARLHRSTTPKASRRCARDLRRRELGRHRRRTAACSRELIREAAEIAIASERMICCWAMGITQHKNGVANVQSIVNFALLRGQIGRRGAGLCPVRGHSNVQGDRTVGIWEKMSDEFLDGAGQGVRLRAAAKSTASTRCGTIRRCTRAGQGLRRAGRQLPVGDAGHALHVARRCSAAGSPCRSRPS